MGLRTGTLSGVDASVHGVEQEIGVASRVAAAQRAMADIRARSHELHALVAEIDACGDAGATGYRGTARLLQDALRVHTGEATRLVTRAGQLIGGIAMSGEPLPPAWPTAAAAAADGAIGEDHLKVVADTLEHLAGVPGLGQTVLAEAEAALVGHARTLAPGGLAKAAHRLVQQLDPDGAAPEEEPEPLDEVEMVRRRDGSLAITARIRGAVESEQIVEVFDALSGPAGPDDPRTLAQRRAETLADLCAQALSPTGLTTPTDSDESDVGHDEHLQDDDVEAGGAGGDPFGLPDDARAARGRCGEVTVSGRALLTVTIDHRWLQQQLGHALLDTDRALDPATARRLACDAGIIPMILGSRGEPLDVGRLSYTVPAGMRRALARRDGGCSFPGCTRRPRRCHAHHLAHWVEGGETRLENLALLCRFHHHLIHHGGWTAEMIDGRPWFRPPTWLDPTRTPRAGGRFPVPA